MNRKTQRANPFFSCILDFYQVYNTTTVSFCPNLALIFVIVRNLGILGLAIVFVIQMMSASLILLNYEVNTSYIKENFCVNKDKPEMHCDGKCYLSKQIKADSEQKSETPDLLTEMTTFVLAVEEVSSFELRMVDSVPIASNSLYFEGSYSNHLQPIFHPPQV